MLKLKMNHSNQIKEILVLLSELKSDLSVPKNIRIRVEGIMETLQNEMDVSVKKNKVLNELDEVANDSNLQPYTRTQVWSVVSLLENL